MAVIRTFVGLNLPQNINHQLELQCQMLRQQLHGQQQDLLRWVKPANRHVTLVFLGNTEERHCLDAWNKLLSKLPPLPTLTCDFSEISHFPDAKSRIIALTSDNAAQSLLPLKQLISEAFNGLLPKPHHKQFRPHVTLARVRKHQHFDFRPLAANYKITFERLGLFQSHLTPTGSEYQLLQEYNF